MLFNSLEYVIFGATVFFLYHLSERRFRLPVLLGASLFFYCSLRAWHLVVILAATTLTTYMAGLGIAARSGRKRKLLLAAGLAVPLLALFSAHFASWLGSVLNRIPGLITSAERFVSPGPIVSIGVSFFTFQAMSYLIDVYKGDKAERHFGWFALYMAFFPKLLQGPIERAGPLLAQLRLVSAPDSANIRVGIYLFLTGLFKKVVIADRLAVYADTVFNDVFAFQGVSLLAGVYAYTLQIYFDFSGYTDMALGTAKLFNIDLTQNFKRPYLAASISEFWRRWHISLSSWLRDYLYIPLGGNRVTLLRRCENLVIVFLICGLWHGASLNYAAWGLLHGFYLVAGLVTGPWRRKALRMLGIENAPLLRVWRCFFIFNLVALGWIFFRSGSMTEAFYVLKHLFTGIGEFAARLVMAAGDPSRLTAILKDSLRPVLANRIEQPAMELVILLLSMALVTWVAMIVRRRGGESAVLNGAPRWLRWATYYILIGWTLFLGAFNTGTQFIYLQF